jgi:nickel/cobalt transporter (NicO) family protein
MSTSAPVLLAAAAGVGFAHAILPDHWMPLATVARTRRWSLPRLARVSGLAGLGHVALSVVLGAIVIAVGLQFRHSLQNAQDAIVGGLLIVTGLAFLVLQARGHRHDHEHEHHHGREHDHQDEHEHEHEHAQGHGYGHGHRHGGGALAVLIPFGAAASPDLTILPVFLAATTAGTATAVGTVLLFGAVTIATFVVLTVLVAAAGYQLHGDWLERRGNAVTGAVLLVIGSLVAAGVL